MVHPIFMTVLRRPDLLANHLANYAELVKGELSSFGTSVAVRAASAAVALVALLLALGLTGISIMLGYLHGTFHWVLVIVPGAAWLLAVIGAALAMRSTTKDKVEDVKSEVEADFNMLRLIKEARNER